MQRSSWTLKGLFTLKLIFDVLAYLKGIQDVLYASLFPQYFQFGYF